jgi:hypothetical protein
LLSFCPLILLSLNACTKRFEGSSIRWFPRIQELQILTFHYKECSSYIFYLDRHVRFMEYINLYMMVGKGVARNLFYPGLRTNKHKLFFNIHHWIDVVVSGLLFFITSLIMYGNFCIINRRMS